MITLINPPSPWAIEPAMGEQLGLCYVVAALKSEGFKVNGLDFAIEDYTKYNQILPLSSDVYGIYCMTSQYKWVKQVCLFLKEYNPKAKIVVGGPHATCCPEDFFKLGVDNVVQGYGDYALNDILNGVEGRLFFQNLMPDRSIFSQYKYKRTINGKKAFHINTIRGCPYSCNYCDKKSVGREVFYRPVGAVLDEIDFLMDKYETNSFVIYDDIFTLLPKRVERFCQEFKKRNIQWRCWARTDLVDREMLAYMKECGLTSITFGVESGDDTVLSRINKKATVNDNWNALRNCAIVGIPVRCSLMFGNPGECESSLTNTIEMVEQCQPDEWNLAVLKPTPGSAFWDYPEKYGIKFDKQAIINSDYQMLNRFEDNGIGNIICSIDSCPDDELKELLPWFVSELERVCPRKNIQDTIQEINMENSNV
jgi:anaerobic magnesium-protoporphyrin IX monomethyl ester cyclase